MTVWNSIEGTIELRDGAGSSNKLDSYSGYHALVPVIIGFSIPLAIFVLAFPQAAKDIRFIVLSLLFLIGLATAVIFFLSLLRPGTALSVVFDPERRVAEVIRSGTFAHSVYTIPFKRIQSVRIETHYDDDGYASEKPVLVLTPRELIELPASTTSSDVALIRRMIGLA